MATFVADITGRIGIFPRLASLYAHEFTIAQVTAAGFMNEVTFPSNGVQPSDFIFAYCKDGFAMLNPSIASSGQVTLVNYMTKYIKAATLTTTGSGTTQTFTDAACTSSSIVLANYKAVTTSCYIVTVAPGSGSFTVTTNTAPGSSTLAYTIINPQI